MPTEIILFGSVVGLSVFLSKLQPRSVPTSSRTPSGKEPYLLSSCGLRREQGSTPNKALLVAPCLDRCLPTTFPSRWLNRLDAMASVRHLGKTSRLEWQEGTQ